MSLLRRVLSMEAEIADGKTYKEIEHTLYAKIVNMVDLEKAFSKEHHEQWQIRVAKTPMNSGEGTIRVRKTIPNIIDVANTVYVQTTKTPSPEDGGRDEVPIPTTLDNFVQFQRFGESGLIKDRYCFPAIGTDYIWEVDVFYIDGAEIGSGKYSEWVKIDLEVSVHDKSSPLPLLPFEVTDLIVSQKGYRTPEEDAIIDKLYDEVFRTKNKFLV